MSSLRGWAHRPACSALSFDGIQDFPGLLRELQTVDVLVMPLQRCEAGHLARRSIQRCADYQISPHARKLPAQNIRTLMHTILAWL